MLQLHESSPVYEQISISPQVVIFFFPCDLSRAETRKRICSSNSGEISLRNVLWKAGTMFVALHYWTVLLLFTFVNDFWNQSNCDCTFLSISIHTVAANLQSQQYNLPGGRSVARVTLQRRGAVIGTRTSVIQTRVYSAYWVANFLRARNNQAVLGYFWKRGKYSGSFACSSEIWIW